MIYFIYINKDKFNFKNNNNVKDDFIKSKYLANLSIVNKIQNLLTIRLIIFYMLFIYGCSCLLNPPLIINHIFPHDMFAYMRLFKNLDTNEYDHFPSHIPNEVNKIICYKNSYFENHNNIVLLKYKTNKDDFKRIVSKYKNYNSYLFSDYSSPSTIQVELFLTIPNHYKVYKDLITPSDLRFIIIEYNFNKNNNIGIINPGLYNAFFRLFINNCNKVIRGISYSESSCEIVYWVRKWL